MRSLLSSVTALLLLQALFFKYAAAAESTTVRIDFQCLPEHEQGTLFSAKTEGGHVTLTVHHGGGADHIPVITDTLYPSSLSWLERLTGTIKQLGPDYELGFDLKECDRTAADQVNCVNREGFEIDGLKVNRAVFYTSEMTRNAMGMRFHGHAVYVSLELNSSSYHFEMTYPDSRCRFR